MTALEQARAVCREAEALFITAGAGMGVDSGLPDFRGTEGFWKAYPPYRHLGFNFMEMANPARFSHDPEVGWGFYGHRLHLYRDTQPHDGFRQLLEFGNSLPGGYFVFTSNVDGHFKASGFNANLVKECHGSVQYLQCFTDCRGKIWPADNLVVEIDESTMRARAPLPDCPDCGGLARPNILMFGDWGWNPNRTAEQETRYRQWEHSIRGKKLVILEFGAGTAVPTVRMESERFACLPEATLIRINPREAQLPRGISLEMGALEAVEALFSNG